jgi:primosomal replication protein N|nr:MAG TPA: Single strand binding protein [Caudoviricetes sp.]
MKNKNSAATVAGAVASEPKKYDCCGEAFYEFDLCVKRLSGAEDLIPVNMPAILRDELKRGDKLCLIGQVRTYNKVVDGKSRLIVVFFALEAAEYTGSENYVELTGFFCKPPVLRMTPLGRNICDVQLAVNRERGKTDYVPLILWGRTAQHIVRLNVGAHVNIVGRLQSRMYQKQTEQGVVEKTAYEVSVRRITEVTDDE